MASVRQSFFVLVHVLVGCVAFALASYYLLSDALSFEYPSGLLAQRPRGFVAACFGLAGASLLLSARRRDLIACKVFGYGSLGVGAFTLWLIFEGMDVSAA